MSYQVTTMASQVTEVFFSFFFFETEVTEVGPALKEASSRQLLAKPVNE